jgi:voltage-gated potassium channel
MGSPVCHEIKNKKKPLVVVEKNPDVVAKLDAEGFLYIMGDATEEHVLLEAGIERAKGLVTVLPTDVENVYVTLTARGLKPDLLILARASDPGSEKKLKRAGASRVVSPYYLSGRKMAQEILQPTITNFFELVFQEREESIDLQMEEIKAGENSHLINTTLQESRIRQDFNLIVVAIKKKDGHMLYNPTHESKVEAGDTLIALGPGPNLDRLAAALDAQP